jgi:hypothetical protein
METNGSANYKNGNGNNNGNGHSFASGQVTEIVGISNRQLYYWELKGLIRPVEVTIGSRRFKKYSEKDIHLLSKVKEYLEIGYTLEATFKKVEPLQAELRNGNGSGYVNGNGYTNGNGNGSNDSNGVQAVKPVVNNE